MTRRSIVSQATIFALVTMLSVNARSETCEAQFVDLSKSYIAAREAETVWQDQSLAQRVVTTLVAIGENGLPKINVKSLEKDGKILLAYKAAGHEPVLAIYKFDASVDGSEFRLVELRQKNGGNSDTVISENPVDLKSRQLYSNVEAHPAIAEVRRSLQLFLGADVTNYIRSTGEWFDFAPAKDLRELAEHSNAQTALRILHLRMRARWAKEVLSRDLLKQVFRGIVLGGVVFGSSYLAQKFSAADEKVQKTILDSLAALLLVEVANLEASAGIVIPQAEKEKLVLSALKVPKKTSEGEVLKLSDIEIGISRPSHKSMPPTANTGTEKFWVLDKSSGRIYIGLAEAVYDIKLKSNRGQEPRVELNTRALVEISAAEMPVTYKIAIGNFKNQILQDKADGK